jgi:CDP-glycerol glycerophosphotransferase (TagB/SpsB family)
MDAREFLLRSGLFDDDWYARVHCSGHESPSEALARYLDSGVAAGHGPNQILDGLKQRSRSPGQEAWLPGPMTLEDEIEFIRTSGCFDAGSYLATNADVASAKIDPLRHFCQYGWKELRNPSPDFDVWWYWSTHLDPGRDAINPLLHHALIGARAGLATRPAAMPTREGFAYPAGKAVRRICLYAGYDRDGVIDDYVLSYLRELSRHADIYYLADCEMAEGELDKLSGYTKGAWAVRHGAYDFGSYSMLARELVGWETIEEFDELVLANDSCYLLRGLDAVFSTMDARRCDWWGMQLSKRDFVGDVEAAALPTVEQVRAELVPVWEQSYINSLHASSYFVAFRKPVILDRGFQAMLDAVVPQSLKSCVILKYEIGLSRYLNSQGYRLDAFVDRLYPFHPLYTLRHFELIENGFPLFKRLLLADNPLKAPHLFDWKQRLQELVPQADLAEVERNLLRVVDHDRLHRNLRATLSPEGVGMFPAMLDDGSFAKADHSTPKYDHWWAFPVCAFDDSFAGNERAVFEEVRKDPSIRKIVLTRRRGIAVDGKNVVVVPLNSPEGQYHLLRAGQIFVKHSPSINAKFPLSPKLHNFINLWHGIPLKRFGYASMDMVDKLDWLREENIKCRAVISSSKMDTLAMAAAFYPLSYREVWATGLPRNDFILRAEAALPADLREQGERLRGQLGGRRLVLFSPTFKNSQEDGYYKFGADELAFLGDWLQRHHAVLGVREHMADKARTYSRMLSPLGILDLSSSRYPDIEILYREAALLVTDYSSCAIDFMLTGKPVVSFAYDYDHYANTERGLFYDLEHVFPGPVCRDFTQLRGALEKVFIALGHSRGDSYAWKRRLFFDHLDDANAWRVVKRVKQLYVHDNVEKEWRL